MDHPVSAGLRDSLIPVMRHCTLIWLILLLLTGITYRFGDSVMHGAVVMLSVMGIAAFKVQLVVNYYMGLHRTRWLWRGIMLGWLLLVTGLISIAYLSAHN